MPSYVYTTVYWSCDILLDETSTSKGIDPVVVKFTKDTKLRTVYWVCNIGKYNKRHH